MHSTLTVLAWLFAAADPAAPIDWIDAAERLGILAAIVLFSVLTGSSLIVMLLRRSEKQEDKAAKAAASDKQQLAKRVAELDAMVTGKLLAALEQTHVVVAQAAEAMKGQAASNDRTAAALEKVTGLVESMAAERTAFLSRPCLIDPKLLGLLRNFLGQDKEPVILGTLDV